MNIQYQIKFKGQKILNFMQKCLIILQFEKIKGRLNLELV